MAPFELECVPHSEKLSSRTDRLCRTCPYRVRASAVWQYVSREKLPPQRMMTTWDSGMKLSLGFSNAARLQEEAGSHMTLRRSAMCLSSRRASSSVTTVTLSRWSCTILSVRSVIPSGFPCSRLHGLFQTYIDIRDEEPIFFVRMIVIRFRERKVEMAPRRACLIRGSLRL